MAQVYTVVINTIGSRDPDGDAMSWVANMLDPETMRVRGLFPSVLKDNTIIRLETDLGPEDYITQAFEGGLNSLMRDPISEVLWWKVSPMSPILGITGDEHIQVAAGA